ncbi:hypothetical protein I7I48_09969 [Histoplasma ohiense]|nr:hypothetical protein I7I48_09969 [Histoplasma ohiense (nom. inval.)]
MLPQEKRMRTRKICVGILRLAVDAQIFQYDMNIKSREGVLIQSTMFPALCLCPPVLFFYFHSQCS